MTEQQEENIFYPKILKVENVMVGGLVGYTDVDDGTYLLRKETLEKIIPSIVEKPLIVDHQEVTKDNIKDISVGTVINSYYNSETGQFDCDIIVNDEEVYENIKNGNNKVSSAYKVTEFGEGGRYCGIEYDAEILNGYFTHLAIVENPRYPDAKILVNNFNNKGEDFMFFKLNKLNEETKEEKKEQKINEGDTIDVDGDEVELKDLIDAYKNSCKKNKANEDEEAKKENEEEKQDEDEKDNACKNEDEEEKENEDSDDDLITKIRKVVKEMLEAKENKKNEDEEDKENEDEPKDEKENKISSYSKSNSLRIASQSCEPEKFEYKTRAERIAESNKKYSLSN